MKQFIFLIVIDKSDKAGKGGQDHLPVLLLPGVHKLGEVPKDEVLAFPQSGGLKDGLPQPFQVSIFCAGDAEAGTHGGNRKI